MLSSEEAAALAVDLEEQAQSVRACWKAFQEAGLLGQARASQEELSRVVEMLASLRALDGAAGDEAGANGPPHHEELEKGGKDSTLPLLTVPHTTELSGDEEPLRWEYIPSSNALRLRLRVPVGIGSSDVEVEQRSRELFLHVPSSPPRSIFLPPRALTDTLRVRLSRKQAALIVTVALPTDGPASDPALLRMSEEIMAAGEPDEMATHSKSKVVHEVVEGLTQRGAAYVDAVFPSTMLHQLRQLVVAALHGGKLMHEGAQVDGFNGAPSEPSGWHALMDPVEEGGVLQQLALVLDEVVGGSVSSISQLHDAAGALVRERFRASVYCPGCASGMEEDVHESVSNGSTGSSTRDSGMPRILTASVLLRGDSGRVLSVARSAGGGECAMGTQTWQLLIYWSDSALCTSAVEVRPGETALLLTTWYSDGNRIHNQERALCAEVESARAHVISGSLEMYQDELQREPEDVHRRWKVVEAALHAKQLTLAREVADVGTSVSGGDALAWVMRGVVAQHDAVAAGGPSTVEGETQLRMAAGSYRTALALEPGHPDALRNILVCLEHLVELEELHALAAKAIRRGVVPYYNAMQRPTVFVKGLRSQPWWDTADFPFVAALEAAAPAIRAEVASLFGDGADALRQAPGTEDVFLPHCDWRKSAGDAGWRRTDGAGGGWRQVVRAGRWNELVLYGGGQRVDGNCALVPKTASAVDAIAEAVELAKVKGGEVLISVVEPGTHIRAHCGPSNNRLTCHLGLAVPPGLAIRVEHDTRGWQEGRCIIFDDSFEHEVCHRGAQRRVVLMFNFWHPDITEDQKKVSMEEYFSAAL